MKGVLVYSSSDYSHLPKTVLSSTDDDGESFTEIILKKYVSALSKKREKLDNASLFLYGKRSEVPENETHKAFMQLLELEKRTKKTIQGIATEIRDCTGKDILFFHKEDPIAISKIMSAYRAICNSASKHDVWHCLIN